jgi:hypothetical protein
LQTIFAVKSVSSFNSLDGILFKLGVLPLFVFWVPFLIHLNLVVFPLLFSSSAPSHFSVGGYVVGIISITVGFKMSLKYSCHLFIWSSSFASRAPSLLFYRLHTLIFSFWQLSCNDV